MSGVVRFLLFIVVWTITTTTIHAQTTTTTETCRVCRDGGVMERPEQRLGLDTSVLPVRIPDCPTLATIAGFVPADTDDCRGIQTIGFVCGCPILDEQSCRLCPTTTIPPPDTVLGPDIRLILENALQQQQQQSSSSSPSSSSLLPFTELTCAVYDAVLVSFPKDSEFCVDSDPVRSLCECPVLPPSNDDEDDNDEETTNAADIPEPPPTTDDDDNDLSCFVCSVQSPNNTVDPNVTRRFFQTTVTTTSLSPRQLEIRTCQDLIQATKTTTTTTTMQQPHMLLNTTQCNDLQNELETNLELCGGCVPENEDSNSNDNTSATTTAVEMCTMCPFGEPTPFPSKTFDFPIPVPTCGILDLTAASYPKDSVDCQNMRVFSKICGCAVREEACSLCPNPQWPMTKPNATHAWTRQGHINLVVEDPTVADLGTAASTCQAFDSVVSAVMDHGSEACFIYQLRGASCGCPSPHFHNSLLTKRIFSIVSILGSLFILQDVLLEPRRRVRTYYQLLLGISIFDLVGSIAHLIGPLALPSYSGVEEAIGNDATCTAQGFFVHLGQTSMYFNLALAVYFWLMICRNWKEKLFRRIRFPIYLVILVVGVALSFAGIPFYEYGINQCLIYPPPIAATWYPAVFFVVLPLAIVLIGATIPTLLVLLEVRAREKASLRYQTNQRSFYWTRRVFWKSFWYLSAFYATYPILITTYFADVRPSTYWLILTSSAISPSQGFWNFCIYYAYRGRRRRHQRRRRRRHGQNHSRRRQQQQQQQQRRRRRRSSKNNSEEMPISAFSSAYSDPAYHTSVQHRSSLDSNDLSGADEDELMDILSDEDVFDDEDIRNNNNNNNKDSGNTNNGGRFASGGLPGAQQQQQQQQQQQHPQPFVICLDQHQASSSLSMEDATIGVFVDEEAEEEYANDQYTAHYHA